MKITFVIGGNIEVYTLEEIKEIDEWAYDSSTYYLIKALEKNQDFIKAVKEARIKLKILEVVYDRSWYENIYFDVYSNTNPSTESGKKKIKDFEKWFTSVKRDSEKIYKRLTLHPTLRPLLPYIIIGNFVYSLGAAITTQADHSFGLSDRPTLSVNITIRNNISEHELVKFIHDNWAKIKEDMKNLPDRPEAYISHRDMLIVDLHDQGKLPFSKIATRIIKELNIENDTEGRINEDSVKTAYHRAKAKIAYVGRKKR